MSIQHFVLAVYGTHRACPNTSCRCMNDQTYARPWKGKPFAHETVQPMCRAMGLP